jgi:ABC-2 type transport system permease protein
MATLLSTSAPQPLRRPHSYWAAADTWVLFQRSVHQIFNAPGQLIAAVAQPVLLTVLMTILFDKAIHTDAPNYVSFIVPGILIGSALQVATVAMISVTSDMTTGMIDRFRSLPMVKASVIGGTVLSSAVRCLLSVVAALLAGFAMGFHPQADLGAWVAALGLVLLVSYAFSWFFAVLGLTSKSVETAQQTSGIVWVLFFVSGVFEPIKSMPSWLQGFATNQPITQTVYAIRALLLGQPVGNYVWVTVAWCVGIIVISIPLAGWLFKRKFQ